MERNNTISLLLGAVVGSIATYYTLQHKDEILDKINEVKENIDHNELLNKAKDKLDSLTQSVQSTIERFKSHDDTDEMTSMMEELAALRAEIKALKAGN
jgi:peptidoglycan hydrolase CwlO-like protein